MRLVRALLVFAGLWLLWTFVIALLYRAAGKENMDATMQAALWIGALQMVVQKIFKTVRRHRERARQVGSRLDPLIAEHLAIDEVLNTDDFTADAMAISDARSRIIAMDERQELIRMAWRRKDDIDFYFEDTHLGMVLQANVHQGDKPGFGSDFNNRIIVPGIMAGFSADGALVGALAADDLRYVTHVSLVLAVDDVSEPLREMNFLDEPVLVGSDLHREAVNLAEEWLARVNVLLWRRSRQNARTA